MGDSHKFFYRLAVGTACLSTLCVLFLAVSIPSIYFKANKQRQDIEYAIKQFKDDNDRIWNQLQKLTGTTQGGNDGNVMFFSRRKRNPYGTTTCQGCNMLSCPQGMSGPAGSPGDDGMPGMPGNSGRSGDDGYDVELSPEDDLPCTICPAGPPGPRGPQGERGMSGYPGKRGESGEPGNPGIDGPMGLPGNKGPSGLRGPMGSEGPQGDTLIAGIGIKGPNGPPGPGGMKGKPGPHGKAAKEMGSPGMTGPSGPSGPPGTSGKYGERGPAGPPGDPGMPASYCPSDCGVSHIVAPNYPSKPAPAVSDSYGSNNPYGRMWHLV